MKEKRYYSDWVYGFNSKVSTKSLISRVEGIFIVVGTVISSLIYYSIIMHNHGENLEAYHKSAYKYLDEIADNVIGKEGINEAAIPKDIVEYEINYKDGEIIFKYSLDNNKGKVFATSASMTLTLSKDFEVLSKEPNFSSKKEYVECHKRSLYIWVTILGFLTCLGMIGASYIVIVAGILVSTVHEAYDMKKIFHKKC